MRFALLLIPTLLLLCTSSVASEEWRGSSLPEHDSAISQLGTRLDLRGDRALLATEAVLVRKVEDREDSGAFEGLRRDSQSVVDSAWLALHEISSGDTAFDRAEDSGEKPVEPPDLRKFSIEELLELPVIPRQGS